jgi:hypothetical protein
MGYDIALMAAKKEDITRFAEAVSQKQPSLAHVPGDEGLSAYIDEEVEEAVRLQDEKTDFNTGVGFRLAAYLGSIVPTWYVRGAILAEIKGGVGDYLNSWQSILPEELLRHGVSDTLPENYALGSVMSPTNATRFLNDYRHNEEFRQRIIFHYGYQVFTLLDVLLTARKEERYVVEAADIIGPRPVSQSPFGEHYVYNLDHCEKTGFALRLLSLHGQVAGSQIAVIKVRGGDQLTDYEAVVNNVVGKMNQELSRYIQHLQAEFDYPLPTFEAGGDIEPFTSQDFAKVIQRPASATATLSSDEELKRKVFYIPHIVHERGDQVQTLHYGSSEDAPTDSYASRVMPGQTLRQAVAADLRQDFHYTGTFDIPDNMLDIRHIGVTKDKQGKSVDRFAVRVVLRGSTDGMVSEIFNRHLTWS